MKQYIKATLRVIYNFQTVDKYYKNIRAFEKIKWFLARTIRNISILILFGIVSVVSGYTWNKIHPVMIMQEKTVEVPIDREIPILQKIIMCESGGSQYDKNGQVLMHANSNGTVDAGAMQINLTVWGKQAKLMGYDLSKESDNLAFGRWLFENYGDTPWSASSRCWSKK